MSLLETAASGNATPQLRISHPRTTGTVTHFTRSTRMSTGGQMTMQVRCSTGMPYVSTMTFYQAPDHRSCSVGRGVCARA
jgi:hypothetical protein